MISPARNIALVVTIGALPCFSTDLTFFAVSDLHYGRDGAPYDSNRARVLETLNALPGRAYPAAAGGGFVDAPQGVLIPGDLTDHPDTGQWARYAADYGVNGEGRLRFPAYDGLGNHEEPGVSSVILPLFLERNSRRRAVEFDSAGYHYSWDWDGVHFVNLNLYSGTTQGNGIGHPLNSVDFLRRDLEKHAGTSGTPVFIMQHYPCDDGGLWWNGSEKQRTLEVLRNYNVIGILHGHTHSRKFYRWQDYDVFDDGAAMYGDLLVFHVTDGRLLALNLVRGEWGTLRLDKNISMGNGSPIFSPRRLGPKRRIGVFAVSGMEWLRGRTLTPRPPLPQ